MVPGVKHCRGTDKTGTEKVSISKLLGDGKYSRDEWNRLEGYWVRSSTVVG